MGLFKTKIWKDENSSLSQNLTSKYSCEDQFVNFEAVSNESSYTSVTSVQELSAERNKCTCICGKAQTL